MQHLESLKASIDREHEELVDDGHRDQPASVTTLLTDKGAVPDIAISRLTFTRASITPALSMLLKETSARVTVIGGDDRYGTISAKDIRGRLPQVLEDLSNTMGFFYTYSNDTLIVSSEQNFSVSYPKNADEAALAELTDTCVRLGARLLKKDAGGRVLVFSAPKKAYLRVIRALALPDTSRLAPATSNVTRSGSETPRTKAFSPARPPSNLDETAGSTVLALTDTTKSGAAGPDTSVANRTGRPGDQPPKADDRPRTEPHVGAAKAKIEGSSPSNAPAAPITPDLTQVVTQRSAQSTKEQGMPAPNETGTRTLQAGASASPPVPTSTSTGPQQASRTSWLITTSDKSVRSLLNRWAKDANYQVIWELPVDLELGATASVDGSFETALQSVLVSLTNSEYPIEAMIYDNRVVRIVKHAKGAR